MDCSLPGLLCPWNLSCKNTVVGYHFLLQGIFPTQGLNPHLLHPLPLVPPKKPKLYLRSFVGQAFVGKVMSLLYNILSRLVIAFLPRSKHLLISWLQPPSAVILEPKKIKSITVSIVFPSICHKFMRHVLRFLNVEFSLLNVEFSLSLRQSLVTFCLYRFTYSGYFI